MIRLQSSLCNNFRFESIAFRRLSYFRGRSSKKDSRKMAPPILSLALPSETGRVLSIQSHTVQIIAFPCSIKIRKLVTVILMTTVTLCITLYMFSIFNEAILNHPLIIHLDFLNAILKSYMQVSFIYFIKSNTKFAGYPTFKRQALNGKQLWELIEGLEANNLLYYTHLLTGYIGSVSFLDNVLEVVKKLRSINPTLTYAKLRRILIGDEGKLYVPQELVSVNF
ncbi:unnamed protein product [Lactuca saligna]|uniref:pyridoxal kinase n=1 Tax=Lactuca saligna TaxID=75948 RepID=A0AA35ZLB8_LACSI|nr:unnamed protein product [Lactuca saligna]